MQTAAAVAVVSGEDDDEGKEGIEGGRRGVAKQRRLSSSSWSSSSSSSSTERGSPSVVAKKNRRRDSSLSALTTKFADLVRASTVGTAGGVDLDEASTILSIPKRCLHDISNALLGIGLLEKRGPENFVAWRFRNDGFGDGELDRIRSELESLDGWIDDLRGTEEEDSPYLSADDVFLAATEASSLRNPQDDGRDGWDDACFVVVRAPVGSTLEVKGGATEDDGATTRPTFRVRVRAPGADAAEAETKKRRTSDECATTTTPPGRTSGPIESCLLRRDDDRYDYDCSNGFRGPPPRARKIPID